MKNLLFLILKYQTRLILKKYRPLVIGITGSVGKTSTKEAIFAVLRRKFNVRENHKNYNNEVGLPLTVIGAATGNKSVFKWLNVFINACRLIIKKDSAYPKMLVLEMGADKTGDIEYLTGMAPCDIGVVTAVSKVHLEFFGSLENVIREKQKIVTHLKESHLAVLNSDDPNVLGMRTLTKAKVKTFGFSESADFRATDIRLSQKGGQFGTSFKLHTNGTVLPVFLTNALGPAQVEAALAALAVASSFGINLVEIVEDLSKFKAPPGRTNLLKGIKNTMLIDDSYNASPASSLVALEILKDLPGPPINKKIAVFGEMLELGSYTETGHLEVGQKAAMAGVDLLVGVGEKARDIIRGAIQAGLAEDKTFYFDNNHDAGIFVQNKIKEGDLVLIKGSQGARMEQIVKELMAEPLKAEDLLVRQTAEWLK
ncbi:MAG: UDP-N-acetylmuramoyl-tripeptide-D-alanyl-D-alanine ligase [Parcubacteria group bacterium GW2011_GWA2_43_17]|nr:MAG: UDP-N-acetylmuramoyl-tripeptide-D-alanyl-D-alanine ligase [Parcubacteria group bacterium GW2011_GWA2_43_17]KKT93059.1 MAG: UDP-N-acetylmuramoyl-tripeptide-D-alanyl-D-alanine ligase [Parcubacteria group bacterium GW2011_GWF2_45_11]KKT96990.1 MAG: UDP-N-acetylmuramoyl-tripeptide-D-alanyl-D-alanine ligase [Parcubacteria group bacterium GW2011_GWC2_45_15]OGY93027.1 MAG: hypothetical protein A2260_02475 [Candidatus Komeilibacteria bacterium RIFOXYA2_FULL_45_9]OGY96100.1 MAG: hypothetical pro